MFFEFLLLDCLKQMCALLSWELVCEYLHYLSSLKTSSPSVEDRRVDRPLHSTPCLLAACLFVADVCRARSRRKARAFVSAARTTGMNNTKFAVGGFFNIRLLVLFLKSYKDYMYVHMHVTRTRWPSNTVPMYHQDDTVLGADYNA